VNSLQSPKGIGALALIPSVLFVIVSRAHSDWRQFSPSGIAQELGWIATVSLPLALAWVLRRDASRRASLVQSPGREEKQRPIIRLELR
jgi:hypothetical protein